MSKEEIMEAIVQVCIGVLPVLKSHEFQPSESLRDLGANSLDRSEILENAMATLGVDIPRVDMHRAENIGQLVDLLHDKITF